MTQDVALLPCPGCGGDSTRVIGGPGTRGGPQYWAGCDHCRWRTWGNTEDEAIAAWNRRAEANVGQLRAEVERWKEHYDDMSRRAVEALDSKEDAQIRAERLEEALREARAYVASELAEERAKFAGYEHCSSIASIEADLALIDAALTNAAQPGETTPLDAAGSAEGVS